MMSRITDGNIEYSLQATAYDLSARVKLSPAVLRQAREGDAASQCSVVSEFKFACADAPNGAYPVANIGFRDLVITDP